MNVCTYVRRCVSKCCVLSCCGVLCFLIEAWMQRCRLTSFWLLRCPTFAGLQQFGNWPRLCRLSFCRTRPMTPSAQEVAFAGKIHVNQSKVFAKQTLTYLWYASGLSSSLRPSLRSSSCLALKFGIIILLIRAATVAPHSVYVGANPRRLRQASSHEKTLRKPCVQSNHA